MKIFLPKQTLDRLSARQTLFFLLGNNHAIMPELFTFRDHDRKNPNEISAVVEAVRHTKFSYLLKGECVEIFGKEKWDECLDTARRETQNYVTPCSDITIVKIKHS